MKNKMFDLELAARGLEDTWNTYCDSHKKVLELSEQISKKYGNKDVVFGSLESWYCDAKKRLAEAMYKESTTPAGTFPKEK